MAKGSKNDKGSSSGTSSGTRPSEIVNGSAPSRQPSAGVSRPSNTATGSIIQRVSNPYTGFERYQDSGTPQSLNPGGGNEYTYDYVGQGYSQADIDRAEQARVARDLANARRKVIDDARRIKKNDPGVVRDQFQKSSLTKTATKKADPVNRPHCMKRPKRGSGGGGGKGFVPFC